MKTQMLFEELISPRTDRNEHQSLPPHQRAAVIDLLSELMKRTVTPGSCAVPGKRDNADGAKVTEGRDHE